MAYCRVSSAAQRPDLKRRVLEEFCAARGIVEFVELAAAQSLRPNGLALFGSAFLTRTEMFFICSCPRRSNSYRGRVVRFGFEARPG
jgi:predicted site-specific integrase-resolvase